MVGDYSSYIGQQELIGDQREPHDGWGGEGSEQWPHAMLMEFHIARQARERYQFDATLFAYNGNVVFASLAACRAFAHRINLVRNVEKHPEQAVHAGQLYAMGLIDEASHALIARYREQFDPEVLARALDWFSKQTGPAEVDKLLLTFVQQFPGSTILSGKQTPQQWLVASTNGRPHREVALEELLLLWAANHNPAFKPFEELFNDTALAQSTIYNEVTRELPAYFATRPLIPIEDAKPLNLLLLLTAPAQAAPTSLRGQLELLRQLWKPLLGDALDRYLFTAGEILHEEELAIWMQFNPPAAQARAASAQAALERQRAGQHFSPSIEAHAQVPAFGDPAHEYEKFSPDTAWMPETVMIAKSTYVWLAQLSKQLNREISRLDDIPDEELATLAHRGINTLWLIGIWERSRASRTIKLLTGNSDAVASAYSLFDYRIADDLGGDAAYTRLRDRAFHHGIRLASDMVPNHMGIDSPWVVEHPEWFISRNDSPYPAYSFNGPDLSADPRVEIKIDDKYYSQEDAAVVFRRRDNSTGEIRYVYHGNDGTSFPWNDTAQLDYMNPAVREHVIQTILHVARLFPVIRFDAAMTLAKRHFHRLWFPGPGSSGAIPSRAEYSMSQAEFDRHMPHEFWREVVDRVAAEVPGTLLLAEAFWLMEGYFVRTLGMHRVYNSAFMVMLRDEDNANYRSVLKNTIEFDPDILKRYVNFMSNPDERTAIDQFGKGDKCFGVTVMMATLPGLPMFGHGQIEGFTEKYGMEYRRPRHDESPDLWLIERHQREIAPLLKLRWLFAESANFLLYDFARPNGHTDENVFAYSNRVGPHAALVIYNNVYAETSGKLRRSVLYADKATGSLSQRTLAEGLGFTHTNHEPHHIVAYTDSLTGLEYLIRAADLARNGLTLSLRAYECCVLLNWRVLYATEAQPWDALCSHLSGRGVPNLDDALANLELSAAHQALLKTLDPDLIRQLVADAHAEQEKVEPTAFDTLWKQCEDFFTEARAAYDRFAETKPELIIEPASLESSFREMVHAIHSLDTLAPAFPAQAHSILAAETPQSLAPHLALSILGALATTVNPEQPEQTALDLFDRLRLREPLAKAFQSLGIEGEESWRTAARIKVLLLTEAYSEQAAESASIEAEPAPILGPDLWQDPDVRWLTGVHASEGHEYIIREPYEQLLWFLQIPTLLHLAAEPTPDEVIASAMAEEIEESLTALESANYRLDKLVAEEALTTETPAELREQIAGEQGSTESEPVLTTETDQITKLPS